MKWGCDLCLQRLSYKLTEKNFKKMTMHKNPNMFLKTNKFKSHKRLKISTDSDALNCNTSDSQLGLLIMRLII